MKKTPTTNWLALEQQALHTKILGKNLIELTSYKGIALWWFARFRLYHSSQANRLAELLSKNSYIFSITDFLYDFLTSLACRFISKFSRPETDDENTNVLMFASNPEWREIFDASGNLRKGNVMLDPIIKELQERNYVIATVTPLKYSISAMRIMIERLKARRTTHIESNTHWSVRTWIKQYYATKYFRNVWKSILENEEEIVALIKEFPVITEIRYYFNSVFGHIAKQIEMAKDIVDQQNPDLILVTSEYGFFERALIVAGKLKGIPTLAIQHGNIGPLHEGYMYPKNSISTEGNVETPYCPVPDRTAVYGRYYYDLLTQNSAYPTGNVVITGQPRYDVLAEADRLYNKEEFCRRLNLNSDGNIVLIATQNLPSPEGEEFLRRILRALKDLPHVQIVLKPHPKEERERYSDIAKEENVNVTTLSREADTFEALYNCDLLIAGFSTVITEATILGKPCVTVHIGMKEDPTPYYRDVTLRVYREEDLFSTIRKVLYDEKTRRKLRKAREEFVYQHVYKPDGRATERVIDLIEKMMRRRD